MEGTPSPGVISTRALTKHYGAVRALTDLTLEVREGEIFGFLGPNGAGKSTMIRTLLGFLHATAGGATVLGLDIALDSVEIRRRTGYLPGGIAFYDSLSGEEVLDYLVDMQGREPRRRAELCDRLEMPGPSSSQGPRLLARHAPEARRDPGAPARPRARHPRRADRGARPAHAAGLLRDPGRPSRRGPHGLLQLPRPVGGRAAVRPGGDHPRRASDGHPRRRRAARAPATPGDASLAREPRPTSPTCPGWRTSRSTAAASPARCPGRSPASCARSRRRTSRT